MTLNTHKRNKSLTRLCVLGIAVMAALASPGGTMQAEARKCRQRHRAKPLQVTIPSNMDTVYIETPDTSTPSYSAYLSAAYDPQLAETLQNNVATVTSVSGEVDGMVQVPPTPTSVDVLPAEEGLVVLLSSDAPDAYPTPAMAPEYSIIQEFAPFRGVTELVNFPQATPAESFTAPQNIMYPFQTATSDVEAIIVPTPDDLVVVTTTSDSGMVGGVTAVPDYPPVIQIPETSQFNAFTEVIPTTTADDCQVVPTIQPNGQVDGITAAPDSSIVMQIPESSLFYLVPEPTLPSTTDDCQNPQPTLVLGDVVSSQANPSSNYQVFQDTQTSIMDASVDWPYVTSTADQPYPTVTVYFSQIEGASDVSSTTACEQVFFSSAISQIDALSNLIFVNPTALPETQTSVSATSIPFIATATFDNGYAIPIETATSISEGYAIPFETTTSSDEGYAIPIETATSINEGYAIPIETATSSDEGYAVPFETTTSEMEEYALPTAQSTVAADEQTTPASSQGAYPTETAPSSNSGITGGFIKAQGTEFVTSDGYKFYFEGTNNYYLVYDDDFSSIQLLDIASNIGLKVLRMWAFIDETPKNGVVFQTFNPQQIQNEALNKLDYVVSEASKRGIRLILTLTNNWQDFGGVDAYVKAFGGTYHDDFFVNENMKNAYKNYVSALVTRQNSITNVAYKDDPTILSWELINEIRCKGSGQFPTSSSCSVSTTTAWASEMCQYIKSIDSNHMVSLGDEGFYENLQVPGNSQWPYSCKDGVDFPTFMDISCLDFGTFHFYAEDWGVNQTTEQWGVDWIAAHAQTGKDKNKPVIMEEYGSKDKTMRPEYYAAWQQAALDNNLAGNMVWMLVGNSSIPDYDEYSVYGIGGSEDCDANTLLKASAVNMNAKSQKI